MEWRLVAAAVDCATSAAGIDRCSKLGDAIKNVNVAVAKTFLPLFEKLQYVGHKLP